MSQYFSVSPHNPQPRLIRRAVQMVRDGGVIAYPTDSCYALGCQIGHKTALKRIRRLRSIDSKHHLTLICKDLSEIGSYAKVQNTSFRLIRSVIPGPYTFILEATADVPNRLLHPKRKTIGVRVPDNRIILALLEELGEPMLSTSLIFPDEQSPTINQPDMLIDALQGQVDLVIDGGVGGLEVTTVIDLVDGNASVVRLGKGDVAALGMPGEGG
jgi:tRNA threonylcarbamoyl adenosine modification protein (Sua5/YciO/YrdC/YwlC family)